MRATLGWVVVVAGCGRVAFDPAADGGGSTQSCSPWGPPAVIPSLTSLVDDWEPAMSPDGNTMVFNRGADALYIATRAGDTFTGINGINAFSVPAAIDRGAAWTANGTELYFASDRASLGNERMWRSTFDGSSFQPPSQVNSLAAISAESATLRSDGLELYFDSSGMIVRATRSALADSWIVDGDQPQLGDVNSVGRPSMSSDGLSLYYVRHGAGTSDIYVATRATVSELFANPTIISELTSTGLSGDPDISPDGQSLYFARDQVESDTGFDLFVTTRTCR